MAWDQSNYLYSLNRSQVNLKLERYVCACDCIGSMSTDFLFRWDEAESDATKALDLCTRNLKALLRRGRARKELGKWDEARAGKDSSEVLRVYSSKLIN